MSVTLHRHSMSAATHIRRLNRQKQLHIDTILTSGQKNTAIEGKELLTELVQLAKGEIDILIGSGVKASVIEQLAKLTGATSFHMSGKVTLTAR